MFLQCYLLSTNDGWVAGKNLVYTLRLAASQKVKIPVLNSRATDLLGIGSMPV